MRPWEHDLVPGIPPHVAGTGLADEVSCFRHHGGKHVVRIPWREIDERNDCRATKCLGVT